MTGRATDRTGATAEELLGTAPLIVRRIAEARRYLDREPLWRLVDLDRAGRPQDVRDELEAAWRTLGALEAAGVTLTLSTPHPR